MTKKEIKEKLDEQTEYLKNNLSKYELDILEKYSGPILSNILSKYQICHDYSIYDKYILDNYIKIIESIIRQSYLRQKTVVYHGCIINIDSDHFDSKTFISTSLDYNIAMSFAESKYVKNYLNYQIHNKECNRTILKITLPKGFPALWMRPFSLMQEEEEILLQDDNSYDVIDIQNKKENVKVISLVPRR